MYYITTSKFEKEAYLGTVKYSWKNPFCMPAIRQFLPTIVVSDNASTCLKWRESWISEELAVNSLIESWGSFWEQISGGTYETNIESEARL